MMLDPTDSPRPLGSAPPPAVTPPVSMSADTVPDWGGPASAHAPDAPPTLQTKRRMPRQRGTLALPVLLGIVAAVVVVAVVGAIVLVNVFDTTTIVEVVDACKVQSGFQASNGVTPPSDFTDVAFPAHSFTTSSGTTNDTYIYQITNVCTSGTSASAVQSFFTTSLGSQGWQTSSQYPAHSGLVACATLCWTKAGPPARYLMLQNVRQSGNVTLYALWSAIAPS
jgi:hypothetical protein